MSNTQKATDWCERGNGLYQAGRYEEALRCYKQAVTFDPNNLHAWNNCGLSLAFLGRHAEAIGCFDAALKINPKYVLAWCNRGISLDAMQRHDEALQCFDAALKVDAKPSIIWQKKGETLTTVRRYEDALRCLDKAVELDSRNILAWYGKGICEDRLGQNAYGAYSTVMMLAMGLDSGFVMDGAEPALQVQQVEPVKIQKEFLDHAIKRCDELNLAPAHDPVGQEKSQGGVPPTPAAPATAPSNSSAFQSQSSTSADVADSARHPDTGLGAQDANNWYRKGKELIDNGSYEEALRCFEKALQLAPEYAYAWREKGFCEEQLGCTLDAIHSYNHVLEFADEEHELIQDVVARLSELEGDASHSIDRQGKVASKDSEAGRATAVEPSDASYKPGDLIGQDYVVVSTLGEGGFGIVYLVHPREAENFFALKTFREKYLTDVQTRERFRKEASIWIQLGSHPYLVQAYLVDQVSGRLFIAMEYIPRNEQGLNNLADYLGRHPPKLQQSLCWAIQICFGMEYAYSKGVRAHRDLKPENIMISQDGDALVTDFGLAAILDSPQAGTGNPLAIRPGNDIWSGKTQMGIGFGTPQYMPPEQFENAAGCDQRSDIFSLGIMLLQMASDGQPPLMVLTHSDRSEAESIPFGQAMYQLNEEIPVPQLNSPLFPIIRRCLEKVPGKRYQRFEQLRFDLAGLLERLGGEAILPPVVQPAQPRELEAAAIAWKAASLDALGRWEEALRAFDNALELAPQSAAIWNNRSLTLVHLGRAEDALHSFDQALKLDPEYAKAWNNKGSALSDLNRPAEALDCLDKALRVDPQYAKAWDNRGNALHQLRRLEDALSSFDQSLKIYPKNAQAWFNKCRSLMAMGHNEEALRCYDRGLGIDPLNAAAWLNKGYILGALNRHEESLQCLNKALEINPTVALAWSNAGLEIATLGRHDEALRYYDKALEIDPRLALAWYNKGTSLTTLGRHAEALRCFDQVLEIDPRQPFAWNNKGSSLGNLGRYEEALRCCDKALEIDPLNASAWNNKGLTLGNLGRHEEALLCYDEALEDDPQYVDPWNNKANYLIFLGRDAEALRCSDKALEIDPQYVPAWYNKAAAEDNLGRKIDAIRSYQQFLKFAPAEYGDFNQQARKRIGELGGR